jgi:hypothetical protein
MPTIFFSHSSRDDVIASAVVDWLRARGFDDIFVDFESIRAGDKWTETLRRASGSCRVVLCLVTRDWLASSECFGEFTAGWYAGRRMIPLLCVADSKLDDTQKKRLCRVLQEDQGVDISRAGAPLALDLDGHPEVTTPFIEGLRAAGALAKVGLDPLVFPVDDRRDSEGNLLKPPFPGLESFGDTDADAAIFYGRSSEIAQVLEDLREFRAGGDRRAYAHAGRAYVIQGASGSGKSSLLKAGVLPRLRRERGWLALRSFRPGADPLLHFAEALAKPIEEGRTTYQAQGAIRDRLLEVWRTAKSSAEKARASLADNLPAEPRKAALNEIDLAMLRRLRNQLDTEIASLRLELDRPAATALIAIDQGEELARAEGDSGDALADYLRAALLPAPEDQPAQCAVVLTVRTDSFQEVQTSTRFEGLTTRLFDLRPLPIYRFDDAIERPASRYGVEIEPELVELLMDDAGGKDDLPLLAFTLQRLWRQYEAEKRIRKANYESIGKLQGLVEDAAERALRGVDPSAQQGPLTGTVSSSRDASAQHVFVPGLAQVNEHGEAIRRVATLSSFDGEGREILSSFEKWRLVVTSGVNVEVSHEALFRVWPRFLHWLEPERARLETLRGLESSAASWDSNARGYDFISHTGRRLRDAQNLMKVADFRSHIDRNSTVKDYLKAATSVARGWRIATWYTVAYFGIATILAVIGIVWVYFHPLPVSILYLPLGLLIILLFGMLTGCLTYLSALLRQVTIRLRFYSDIVTIFLVTIIFIWLIRFWDLPSNVYAMLFQGVESFGESFRHGQTVPPNIDAGNAGQMRAMWDLTAIDNRTLGIFNIFYLGLPWLLLMFPLSWAAVQLLWLVTVPFSFLARKFAASRKASTPQIFNGPHIPPIVWGNLDRPG